MAVSSKDSRRSLLDHELGAVSIVFDLVNPVLALGWLIDRRSELGFDETKAGCCYARHRAFGDDTAHNYMKFLTL
jgi:hypothetical protein